MSTSENGPVTPEQAAAETDAPLTHFFHCWRFADHHACAVALVERQGEENYRLITSRASVERELGETARVLDSYREDTARLKADLARAAAEINRYRQGLQVISGYAAGTGEQQVLIGDVARDALDGKL